MTHDFTDARRSGDCALGGGAGSSPTADHASPPYQIPSVGGSISDAACLLPSETTPGAVSAASGGFFWEPTKRGAAPLELLRQWQAEGLTYYAIGKRIGRDASTVKKRLENYGRPPREVIVDARRAEFRANVERLWSEGCNRNEIAKRLRADERRVSAIVRELPPRPPTRAASAGYLKRCQMFLDLVAAGYSFRAAYKEAGIGKNQYRRLVVAHNLKSRPAGRPASAKPRREKAPPVARMAKAPEAAPPNPYRTAAQNEQIQRAKVSLYALTRGKGTHVPPPPNAEQLIRDAIAAGRVTRCPPRCAAPIQNGTGL